VRFRCQNIFPLFKSIICQGWGRHDIHPKDIQYNDTSRNDIQYNDTRRNDIQYNDTRRNDIQQNALNCDSMRIKCHYAECLILFIVMRNIVMLSINAPGCGLT